MLSCFLQLSTPQTDASLTDVIHHCICCHPHLHVPVPFLSVVGFFEAHSFHYVSFTFSSITWLSVKGWWWDWWLISVTRNTGLWPQHCHKLDRKKEKSAMTMVGLFRGDTGSDSGWAHGPPACTGNVTTAVPQGCRSSAWARWAKVSTVQFSSVQDGICVLKNNNICTPPHLSEVSPTSLLKQVQCLSDVTMAVSHPFEEDHLVLPLSTSLSSRWSIVWCPWLCTRR